MLSKSYKDLKILRYTGVQSVPLIFSHVVQETEICSPKESKNKLNGICSSVSEIFFIFFLLKTFTFHFTN